LWATTGSKEATGAPSPTIGQVIIQVTVPGGGRASRNVETQVEDAVIAAFRRMGLNQTGDSLQVGGIF
jgi:hypothetical protein